MIINENKILLLMIFFFCGDINNAIAKDFGKQGATFEVKEEGFMSMMQRKLQKLNLEHHQQKMQDLARKKVEEPAAVEGISKATRTISYNFDPSYVLDQDVVLPCGKLLYTRGERVNPLDHMVWNGKIVFIDGRDQTQIAWVKDNHLQKMLSNKDNENKSPEIDETKIVLTGGKPLELEREIAIPIYFDQAGELTTKFNITHVPALVEQEGKYLKVTEINISEKN